AGEDANQRKQRTRLALLVPGVLVLAILIAEVVWIRWPSTTNLSLSNSSGSTQTNQQASDTTTRNPAAPAGMVYVPRGAFTMGRDSGDQAERPAHKVTVKPFFIDLHEVTNEEYAKYWDD